MAAVKDQSNINVTEIKVESNVEDIISRKSSYSI
jgi:hypothetical protein